MVKQNVITDRHRAQEIASLIITNPIPTGPLAGGLCEVVDRERRGLGFHQPIPTRNHPYRSLHMILYMSVFTPAVHSARITDRLPGPEGSMPFS